MADRRNLIIFRAKHGLTRQEMADRIGVARSTYSDIENAKRNCSQVFLIKLQTAFAIRDEDMWSLTKVIEDKEEVL